MTARVPNAMAQHCVSVEVPVIVLPCPQGPPAVRAFVSCAIVKLAASVAVMSPSHGRSACCSRVRMDKLGFPLSIVVFHVVGVGVLLFLRAG